MDPITGLDLAVNIIQIIDTTTKAVKYLNDVKDAPKDRALLAQEATSTLVLLTQLGYRLEGTNTIDPWHVGIRSLGALDGPLAQLLAAMNSLAIKLEPSSRMRKVAKVLIWSIEKKESVEILGRIQRINVLISVALQGDQMYVHASLHFPDPRNQFETIRVTQSQGSFKGHRTRYG